MIDRVRHLSVESESRHEIPKTAELADTAVRVLDSRATAAPNLPEEEALRPAISEQPASSQGEATSCVAIAADVSDKGPETGEPSQTEAVLAVIEHANSIDRIPDNSIIENIEQEKFSQTRLDQLYARWDDGQEGFFATLEVRSELVYEIHKETAKPGCTGGFSAARRRLELAASTAYDMIQRHKIRIGEMEDPDAPDSRDDEEEQEEQKEGEETKPKVGGAKMKNRRAAPPRQRGASPRVSLSLSGPIRKAVDAVKIHFHQPNAKAVIQFCVLRVAREIDTPLASRGDDAIAHSRSRRSPLILPDNDDHLSVATANSEAKSVTSEYASHPPSPQEAESASGAA
jgi:hypothetical protein